MPKFPIATVAATMALALSGCASYVPPPPAFHAALQQPYRLDSGDAVRITVFEQDSLTNTYSVDQSGYIAFPLVGAVPARGPGRPRLGVVAREVTLLPRHWDWLAIQPGGASVALRKLVEVARRDSETRDRVRQASAVAYRFMSTIAGHEAGFEEASRALFAGDQAGFEALIAGWPVDVRHHLKRLAADAFRA